MNKTKIYNGLCAIEIAGSVTFNYNLNAKSDNLSDVDLAKIEALASGEEGGKASCTCTKDCGNGITASCTGYQWCRCNSGPGSWYVECDGIRAEC